jgi:DNA-binding transcriptional ArsR family regulator
MSPDIPDVFVAIADPTRRHILHLLAEQELPVNDLSAHFPISRPAISKHLRILRQAGLVEEQKRGRYHYYFLRAERLQEIRAWVAHFDAFWSEKLTTLKEHVEKKP